MSEQEGCSQQWEPEQRTTNNQHPWVSINCTTMLRKCLQNMQRSLQHHAWDQGSFLSYIWTPVWLQSKKPSFTIVNETKSTLSNNVSQLPFLFVRLRLQQHLAWWKQLWQLVSFEGSPFLAAWSMQKVSILNIYIYIKRRTRNIIKPKQLHWQ